MDLMIDLETLGTLPGCGIQQIGYCVFNKSTDEIFSSGIWYIDKKSNVVLDLKSDQATLDWWEKQSPEARELFERADHTIFSALHKFVASFNWKEIETIWSHGATFDIPILDFALRAASIKTPWAYNSARDTRTLFSLFPPEKIENELKHSALSDAITQAKMVQSSWRKFNGH